jgi:hypothetical protein
MFVFQGMLAKVPSTPNDSNTVRPSGIPIQSRSTADPNSQKTNGPCC